MVILAGGHGCWSATTSLWLPCRSGGKAARTVTPAVRSDTGDRRARPWGTVTSYEASALRIRELALPYQPRRRLRQSRR
jgi:hypothetical protein